MKKHWFEVSVELIPTILQFLFLGHFSPTGCLSFCLLVKHFNVWEEKKTVLELEPDGSKICVGVRVWAYSFSFFLHTTFLYSQTLSLKCNMPIYAFALTSFAILFQIIWPQKKRRKTDKVRLGLWPNDGFKPRTLYHCSEVLFFHESSQVL